MTAIGIRSEVEVVDLFNGSSIGLRFEDLIRLRACVADAEAAGKRGVVITHGTDTLEETAYFLALTVPRGMPVVLTGAMYHEGAGAADGPQNLADALATASDARAGETGPLVVMGGKIHAGRFVSKSHATAPDAFTSMGGGIVGELVEARPRFFFLPAFDDFLGAPSDPALPRVEIWMMTVGGSTTALAAMVDAGVDGLVVSGFGAGHVAPQHLDVLQSVVDAGIPVVVASRCSHPATLSHTYAVDGAEIDLQRRGMLMAGSLTPLKARLRLTVALGCGLEASSTFPVL